MDTPTVKQQAALDVVADYAGGATVGQVQDRLKCPRGQARSLLEALRYKGYVSKRRDFGRVRYSLVPGT